MYSFNNDYSEGAHPKILEAMMNCNLAQNGGYGLDIHCENARRLIKEEIGRNDADVHFITGGTQTNLITIAAALSPWQAVIRTALLKPARIVRKSPSPGRPSVIKYI